MKHDSSRFLLREDTGEFVTKIGGFHLSKNGPGKYRVEKRKDGQLVGEIRAKKLKHGDFNYEDGPVKLVKEAVWSFFKDGRLKKLPVKKGKIWKPTYGFRTLDEAAEKLVRAIKSKQIA